MNEIDKTNMSEQTKFRLGEIVRIENYFHQEINQRKLCSKKLSKYGTAFDYIDKILIVLSATSSGVCVISSAAVVGAPVGNSKYKFYFIFFFNNRNNTKITKHNKKKKKHAKILMLAKSKLDSIETLVSQVLSKMKMKNLIRLLGRKKYERMKENVRNVSEKKKI